MPMRAGLSGMVIAVVVQCAGSACAHEAAVAFPEASAAAAPERTVRFQMERVKEAVVASYRFKPRPGLTQWFIAQWCGVTVSTGRATSRPILAIGTGVTGSVTCLGLKDAGSMPPDGPIRRIGLVYRTASPNFPGVTAVLLALDPVTGEWTVDHHHDVAFDHILPAPSLASMRRILSDKHR